MTTILTGQEIALRLGLTVLAGALIGFNRSEHGRPAGLRTTMLVCLAASLSMIQANLLLGAAGRPADSFVTLDLMRLPLGILSGMGFIGGGVILKRQNLVFGITTAATLWFVTVLGLCFGGGQTVLGSCARDRFDRALASQGGRNLASARSAGHDDCDRPCRWTDAGRGSPADPGQSLPDHRLGPGF